MAARLDRDSVRVALLHLTNGDTLPVPDSEWPPVTHGDDSKAARAWSELTGLRVTIKTTTQTTFTP